MAAEVIVTGYAVRDATTATKTDALIGEIPQSIQVVPHSLLQDRGVTRMDQLVDTVSGIHAEANYGGNASTFFNVRGFSSYSGLRDGFRNQGYIAARDVQAIERVEVLKGPSSVLYGASGSLGGYINTVSKRPQRGAFADIGLTAGNYGQVRPTLDVNRPLNDSGTVRARMNGAYERNHTFFDSNGYRSYSLAPVLTWDIGEASSLTVLTEYNRLDRESFDFGIPNIPQAAELPRRRYYGLDVDHGKNETASATAFFERRLDASWRWREAAHFTYANQISTQTFPDTGSYTGGPGMPYYTYLASNEIARDYSLQSELLGELRMGRFTHDLLAGFERARTRSGYKGTDVDFFILDLYDARNNSPLEPAFATDPSDQYSDNSGLYVQDFLEVAARLKVLAGLRADWFVTRSRSGLTASRVSDSELSPRLGTTWQATGTTAFYANWSRAFAPVTGHNVTGAAFRPERADQFELGVKESLWDGKLSATFAVYELTRAGILTADPQDPSNQIQLGEQRSRGVELDINGQPLPGWNLVVSYAYTDAEVTRDNLLPEGDALADVPRHSGSVWTTYAIQSGALQGLGFGMGALHVGTRTGNLPNTLDFAPYWKVDASAFYRHRNWKLQLNVLNVFNEKYFVGGSAGVFNYTVFPSAPTTVQATVGYRY